LVKQYGIRKEADCTFMIGDAPLTVDRESNITIYGKGYRGIRGLWELLTHKKVNKEIVSTQDMKAYKNILELTNAHLEGYEPSGNIQITKGTKFKDVISKLFPQTR
jgi:hypothetical protein